jgi:hypothetical protein
VLSIYLRIPLLLGENVCAESTMGRGVFPFRTLSQTLPKYLLIYVTSMVGYILLLIYKFQC